MYASPVIALTPLTGPRTAGNRRRKVVGRTQQCEVSGACAGGLDLEDEYVEMPEIRWPLRLQAGLYVWI